MTRLFPFFAAITIIAALGGCARPEPSLQRIAAKNYGAFYYWRSSVSSQFSSDGWREFNDAVQELKLSAMARGVTGNEAINQAMCDQIDGRSVAEVLRLADQAKLERLEPMGARLKTIVDANALLATRPGDVDLADALAQRRANQERRLQSLIAEIAATKQRLIAHGGVVPPVMAGDAKAAVLSRDEALAEFARLVQTRREIASLQYGDWPARIDRTGGDLAEDDRAQFEEKTTAAKYNGHSVIPVYVRGNWRIYDSTVNFPEFSDAVLGNLTRDDRRTVEEDWADSEAEIWARKQASQESAETVVAKFKSDIQGVMQGVR